MELPSGKKTGSLTPSQFQNLDRRDLEFLVKPKAFRAYVFGGKASSGGLGEGKAFFLAREMLERMRG